MSGPNFFLVGAAKSGTTTLYTALRAHDSVYLPALKEPHVYGYLADPTTANHSTPTRPRPGAGTGSCTTGSPVRSQWATRPPPTSWSRARRR